MERMRYDKIGARIPVRYGGKLRHTNILNFLEHHKVREEKFMNLVDKALSGKSDDFRYIEVLTHLIMKRSYNPEKILSKAEDVASKQRLGYICDVAHQVAHKIGYRNESLLTLKTGLKNWRKEHKSELKDVYFTDMSGMEGIENIIQRSSESKKWNVVSNYTTRDISGKL